MTIKFGRHELADHEHDDFGLYRMERYRITFPNGYGASVIRGTHSYGGNLGLWELGVTLDDQLTYDTPITDDVLGHLDDEAVAGVLDQIEALGGDA